MRKASMSLDKCGDRRTINQKGGCTCYLSVAIHVYKYVGCGVVSSWNDIDSWVTTSPVIDRFRVTANTRDTVRFDSRRGRRSWYPFDTPSWMCKVVSQVSLDSMRLTLDTAVGRGGGDRAANHRQGRNDCCLPPSSPSRVITKQWVFWLGFALIVWLSGQVCLAFGSKELGHPSSKFSSNSAWYFTSGLAHYQTLIIASPMFPGIISFKQDLRCIVRWIQELCWNVRMISSTI